MNIDYDVPFETYLHRPELSRSTLKEGRNSMAHLKAAWDGERKKIPTDDMILGSALHTAFLEPELVSSKVIVWDGGTRRGKEWEAFKAENASRYILTANQNTALIGMIRSLRSHPEVRAWLSKIEHVEVCARGDVFGVPFKARCDALTSDPLIDLKMTNDAGERAITQTVINFGYDLQAFLYTHLFNRDRFMLLCVEPEPPYDVVPYELSPAFLRVGKHIAGDLINQVKWCLENNRWPGRSEHAITLEPPQWHIPQELSEVIV